MGIEKKRCQILKQVQNDDTVSYRHTDGVINTRHEPSEEPRSIKCLSNSWFTSFFTADIFISICLCISVSVKIGSDIIKCNNLL